MQNLHGNCGHTRFCEKCGLLGVELHITVRCVEVGCPSSSAGEYSTASPRPKRGIKKDWTERIFSEATLPEASMKRINLNLAGNVLLHGMPWIHRRNRFDELGGLDVAANRARHGRLLAANEGESV